MKSVDSQTDAKLEKAFKAIADYLKSKGWRDNFSSKDMTAAFLLIDPITGIAHRQDFAFIVQTERDYYQLIHT